MHAATRGRLVATLALLTCSIPVSADTNALDRDSDPVVLTGRTGPGELLGRDPASIVAFRWGPGWTQIPVQVDERDVVDFGVPYDTTAVGVGALVYTDSGTFTGSDSDPTFDLDDELVFMAKDAGGARAPWNEPDPPGVLPATRVELWIGHGADGVSTTFAYLFTSDGSLMPDAGADYVTYDFNLLSGGYKTTYGLRTGPNPENSQVTTAYYRVHFADRWIRDETNVYTGGAPGTDILDRHKNLFAPGNCSRSEETFSAGEGCFVANIDGPVRAIRSYLGANSGPFTQREHIFYERREDLSTFLRVHAISGVMDYFDYSSAASGMTYANDLNLTGVPVDGSPDAVTAGDFAWEMITGAQGTLVMAEGIDTDIPGFAFTLYYSDDAAPSVTQCTGDAFEYGASGAWVQSAIPNTDPYLGAHSTFTAWRTVYYEAPNRSAAAADSLAALARAPLVLLVPVAVSARPPSAVALAQNAPNPFAATTTIGFAAPVGARVTLRVYDVSGRLVATLWDGEAAGAAATWDGTGRDGRRVPAGVYFYRLVAAGRTLTRKLVLR